MDTNQLWNWCFTVNNYTDAEVDALEHLVDLDAVAYLIFGYEVGEEGTPHLQGYLELASKKRLAGVKQMPGMERAHLAGRRGSQEQAIYYCMKGEQSKEEWKGYQEKGPNFGLNAVFIEFGKAKADRKKQTENLMQNRLRSMSKIIRDGASEDQIFEFDPIICVRHDRWIDKQKSKRRPVRKNDLKVFVYYGPPGTGKTRLAYETYEELYSIPIGKDLWFDGYNEEKEVLLDDFSGNLRLVDLLRLLDRYPILVPRKGGFVWWCPDVIILTCNVHPKTWYNYEKRMDSEQALRRRLTSAVVFNEYEQMDMSIDDFWAIPVESRTYHCDGNEVIDLTQ